MNRRALLKTMLALPLAGCLSGRGLVLLALMTLLPVSAQTVDLVVTNGVIVTMNDHGDVFEPGYVAIDKGRIVGVGEGVCPFRGVRRVDATNRAVVPGLVNAHTHLPMVLFRGLADDLPLDQWLRGVIFPAEAANLDEDFVRVGARLGLSELIRGGVTTYADMYYFESAIAQESRKAGVRAVLGQTVLDFPAPDFKDWPSMLQAVRKFATEWKDDALITPAIAPHAPYTVKPDHWRDVKNLADELDIPILTHLAEAPLEVEHTLREYGRRPVPLLQELGVLSPRLTGAHVIYVEPEEMRTLARLGVGVAHCPESNMKVAVGVSPVPDLLQVGVRVGLGTDGAASNNDLDMWQEMDTAAKIHKSERRDPTVMPARQVFRLATMGGAEALHMEQRIGSLEVGKAGDLALVALDRPHHRPRYDIYSLLVYATRASDVTDTVVNGRLLMEKGTILTIDQDQLVKDVEVYRARIPATIPK